MVAPATRALEVEHGSVAGPTRPGLGIDVDEAARWRSPVQSMPRPSEEGL
jgi:L-alanine-DL-glutamate epimerase-like enolase superfamily enzyme